MVVERFVRLWRQVRKAYSERRLEIALALVAFLTVSALALIVSLPWIECGLQSAFGIWKSWQTLIVGLLALVASLIGLIAATTNHRESLLRRARSERAMLPFRLSSLCTILQQNGSALQAASSAVENGQQVSGYEWLPIPSDLVEGFSKEYRAKSCADRRKTKSTSGYHSNFAITWFGV